MHDVAGNEPAPGERWEPLCASETLWVAEDDDAKLLGFLASGVHDDILFIYELAVAYDHQRRGAAAALLTTAEDKARARGLKGVYLTTFCDVPFNGPYYQRRGYSVVEDAHLPPQLYEVMEAERRQWTAPDRRRCAMVKLLG